MKQEGPVFTVKHTLAYTSSLLKSFALLWLWAAKSPTGAVFSGTLPGDLARVFPASVSGLCAERCPGAEWPDGSGWPCSRGRPRAQCPPLINLIPGREEAGMCICCPSSAQEGLAGGGSLAPSWIQGALSRFRICYNSRPAIQITNPVRRGQSPLHQELLCHLVLIFFLTFHSLFCFLLGVRDGTWCPEHTSKIS